MATITLTAWQLTLMIVLYIVLAFAILGTYLQYKKNLKSTSKDELYRIEKEAREKNERY